MLRHSDDGLGQNQILQRGIFSRNTLGYSARHLGFKEKLVALCEWLHRWDLAHSVLDFSLMLPRASWTALWLTRLCVLEAQNSSSKSCGISPDTSHRSFKSPRRRFTSKSRRPLCCGSRRDHRVKWVRMSEVGHKPASPTASPARRVHISNRTRPIKIRKPVSARMSVSASAG